MAAWKQELSAHRVNRFIPNRHAGTGARTKKPKGILPDLVARLQGMEAGLRIGPAHVSVPFHFPRDFNSNFSVTQFHGRGALHNNLTRLRHAVR
jgi:hypothetical protein